MNCRFFLQSASLTTAIVVGMSSASVRGADKKKKKRKKGHHHHHHKHKHRHHPRQGARVPIRTFIGGGIK